MSGSTRRCSRVTSPAGSSATFGVSPKTRSSEGIFFSISDHSSTRRAPSRSTFSGLMATSIAPSSGVRSGVKEKVPWRQVKR
jgi:hypothetical protein